MSATNRGGGRVALDAYYTPDDVAARCVAALPDAATRVSRVLEPSVGGGAFVRAIRAVAVARWGPMACPPIRVCDVNPDAPGLVGEHTAWVGDFLAMPPGAPYGLVVGNPPYSHAEAHIRHALAHVAEGGYVAFLLRLAMLESVKRRPLWAEHPPISVHVLSARPSFTGGGTDSAAYGWFCWRRGYTGAPSLGWL